MKRSVTIYVAAAALAGLGLVSLPAHADDAAAKATLAEIKATLGFVPTFINAVPMAALPGAWAEVRDTMYSDTALDAKTKSLISLAVAAQIPCEYCVFDDTNAAKKAGATDEQIKEAVAVAASTRYWSTVFHGNQVDLDTFKKELGGM